MSASELCDITGHWIWQRDIGEQWLLDETAGPIASLYHRIFASEAEHWFRVREDGKWVVKIVTSSTESDGEERTLHIGSRQEGMMVLAGEEIDSTTSTYVVEGKLVIEWKGLTQTGTRVHLKNTKEVVDGMYHSTVEDLVRHAWGTRIFRRYPWYKIYNLIGEAVTLKTYSTTDYVFLVPSMTVEVAPGVSYIDASSRNVDKEQAFFCLADGRDFTRIIDLHQTVTLKHEYFKHFAYYEIENLTGEDISMAIYWPSDDLYIVPAKTVVVKPGISYVTASSRGAAGDQAIFTLPNGRSSDPSTLQAFQSYALDPTNFN